jgi:hypothetical protein
MMDLRAFEETRGSALTSGSGSGGGELLFMKGMMLGTNFPIYRGRLMISIRFFYQFWVSTFISASSVANFHFYSDRPQWNYSFLLSFTSSDSSNWGSVYIASATDM